MARKSEPGTELLEQPRATGVQLLDTALLQQALDLDRTAQEYAAAIQAAPGHIQKALLTARGIQALRQGLGGKVLAEVMALMNSPLGFLTDRGPHARSEGNKTPYPVEVVRDCVVEALLHGFYLSGNEFNIIAGRFFGAQNGWRRKLEDVPGISDIRVAAGVPMVHNGQTVCRVALSWKVDGQADELRGADGKPGVAFPVTVTAYSTADQTIGKAKRKAYKLAFEQATGSKVTAPDGEVGEPPDGLPTQAAPPGRQLEHQGNGADGPCDRETREKINSALSLLDMPPEVFAERCRELGADPRAMTQGQAGALLAWLEAKTEQEVG